MRYTHLGDEFQRDQCLSYRCIIGPSKKPEDLVILNNCGALIDGAVGS